MALLFIRTVIIYLVIIVFMRMMGKRQLGELEPSELVVAVLISNVASAPLQDTNIPLAGSLMSVGVLVTCEILTSAVLLKSVRLRALVCGKPSLIISDGVIDQQEMEKNRYTLDELLEELRKQSVTDITTVRDAVLETDGTLSVMLYPQYAPMTPDQAGVDIADEPYPVVIVNQGRILSENLKVLGKSERWLVEYLNKSERCRPDSIYLMTCDKNEKTVIIPFVKRRN